MDAEQVAEVTVVIERILVDALGCPRRVHGRDTLTGDLGLDSLGLITLAVGLEDHFRVELAWSGDDSVRTVAELAELVVAELRRQRGIAG